MTEAQQNPTGDAPPCPKCGGEMWDNRANKKNPKAPDFKCKAAGCEGVIWPPRDPNAPRAVATPKGTPDDPACPICGGKMWDDRASKRNPRAPDFKCRNKPRFAGGPGCEGVIWPPRDGEKRASSAPTRNGTSPRTNGAAPAQRSSAAAPPPPLPVERDFSDDEAPDFEREDELPF
jgi:hypothetical protein